MSGRDMQRHGMDLLHAAAGNIESGSMDVGAAQAALATAEFEAINAEINLRFSENGRPHPFDDERELRAWCLDRAVSMRGFMSDGKEVEQLLGVAELFRAYVTGD